MQGKKQDNSADTQLKFIQTNTLRYNWINHSTITTATKLKGYNKQKQTDYLIHFPLHFACVFLTVCVAVVVVVHASVSYIKRVSEHY